VFASYLISEKYVNEQIRDNSGQVSAQQAILNEITILCMEMIYLGKSRAQTGD